MTQELVVAETSDMTAWQQFTADAATIAGGDLEKGDILIGYPMCLTGATFRQGDYVNAKTGEKGFYVSLETVIGPAAEIAKGVRRKRIPEENIGAVEPGEILVFNEAGTGVYRQTVKYLEMAGHIKITSDLPEEGAYGETRWDASPATWEVAETGEFRYDKDGNPVVAFSFKLLCPRGLRASDYENEYTKTGRTRYIA